MIKPSLGRGLSSLIPQKPVASLPSLRESSPVAGSRSVQGSAGDAIVFLPPHEIHANPYQPRRDFEPASLAELKNSIQKHGILQPLLVTRNADGYELVAGERRLRAAKELRLSKVPVMIRSASDLEKLELAMIENIQRQDLNPIEEAQAYQRLCEEFDLVQEEVALKVGKSRSYVANVLRLLKLPPEIQKSLSDGKITMSHAKVLLALPDAQSQLKMWKEILAQGLSVHATSHHVSDRAKPLRARRHPFLETQEEDLQQALGTRVRIQPSGKGGKIIIDYYSGEELISLAQKLLRGKR